MTTPSPSPLPQAGDTELVLPAEWDNLAVAQGQLQATVTYTYTPATDLGPQLPGTGSDSNRIVTIAVITLLLGLTAVLAAKRWRRPPPHPPPAADRASADIHEARVRANGARTVP